MIRKIFILLLTMVSCVLASEQNSDWKVIINRLDCTANAGEKNQVMIEVYNVNGEKAYSISKALPDDVPFPAVSVFEAGELMVIYSYNGLIEFYDSKGNLVNTIKPNYNSSTDNERIIKYETLNKKSALLISEPKLTFTKLIIVSSNGEMNLEKEVEGNHATGIEISKSGNVIAAGTYAWIDTSFFERTSFFNFDGDFIGKVDLSFSNGGFTEDENKFLGFTNSNLYLAEIHSLKILWSKEFPSDKVVADAALTKEGVAVLSSDLPILKKGKWLYSNLHLNVLDKNGNLIEEKKVEINEIESAKIIVNGNSFSLKLDGKQLCLD